MGLFGWLFDPRDHDDNITGKNPNLKTNSKKENERNAKEWLAKTEVKAQTDNNKGGHDEDKNK